MRQRERDSLAAAPGEPDPHSLLFGLGDDHPGEFEPAHISRADRRREHRAHAKRNRRRGRFFVLLAVVLVAAVAGLVVPRVVDYFTVADYSGPGTGSVTVIVPSGASASDIGAILKKADVVKSADAFRNAAANNPASQNIQPGAYRLRLHMSGKAALAALLNPASRDRARDALVPEGATSLDVAATLTRLCGAGDAGAIKQALSSGADLGIPVSYKVGNNLPSSVEGFLYPATYTLDPQCQAADVLEKMVSRFILQDRETRFAASAAAVGLTPYQALIVASIAQSEAKYPEDMPKVVRTILNRLKANQPLQFDSTSSYACKLQGVPAASCVYHQVVSPYNTYAHTGLPPTPIDNPGAEAMNAAVHPAAGNWLFFVNQDKEGHLFFTNDAKAFQAAAEKCAKNNWGCG